MACSAPFLPKEFLVVSREKVSAEALGIPAQRLLVRVAVSDIGGRIGT